MCILFFDMLVDQSNDAFGWNTRGRGGGGVGDSHILNTNSRLRFWDFDMYPYDFRCFCCLRMNDLFRVR